MNRDDAARNMGLLRTATAKLVGANRPEVNYRMCFAFVIARAIPRLA
jgi:hypothetical protein